MTRIAVLTVLFATAPLFGQTKEIVEEVDAMLAQQRIAARHAEERNEDIEVLRRLLNKAFGFDHVTIQLPEALQSYIGSTAIPGGGSGMAPPTTGFPNNIGLGGGSRQPSGGSGFSGFGQQPLFGGGQPFVVPLGKRISQSVGPFDGVYLKGSGVVLTLRVPKDEGNAGLCVGGADKNLGLATTCNGCHNEAKAGHKGVDPAVVNDCTKCHSAGTVTSNLAKPVSDWERIRADVRGEKPPEVKPVAVDPKKPRAVMCKPGDIRELLAAQLHAHAKNLRHLEKTDWVTVVVTFDEPPAAKTSRIPVPTDKPGFSPDELQSLTLGDLHVKQGKHAEAAAAYEKGLARYRDAVIRLTFPPTMAATEVQKVMADTETSVRGIYKALAVAYMNVNDLDRAKAALEKATTLKVEVATAGAEKPKPQLPAKLVLAVAKSDIERNPKLEDLRKGAHVELIGFPADTEKK